MATYKWNGTVDGDLTKAANWNLNSVPGVAVPGGSDTAEFDDPINHSPVFGPLGVSQFIVNDGTLALSFGSITAGSEIIDGSFDLQGNTNSITGGLTVGSQSAGNADYHLKGGNLSVGGDTIVALSGQG